MEESDHARVLRALHEEILAYGLNPVMHPEAASTEDQDSNTNNTHQDTTTESRYIDTHSVSFVASPAGAFPLLRYTDGGGGRVIVIRALTMFDDLIVSAKLEEEGGRGAVAGLPGSRRTTFDVSHWCPLWHEGRQQQQQQHYQHSEHQVTSTRPSAAARSKKRTSTDERESATAAAAAAAVLPSNGSPDNEGAHTSTSMPPSASTSMSTSTLRPSPLREEFRSRVRSGLLFHLCPPSGQFADLFGVEEGLRRRVLGVLGAKDVATFGMTSRAAAVSALSDSLWAPLVDAEFSEREQHAELFLRSSPPPTEASSREDEGCFHPDEGHGIGDGDGNHANSTAGTDVHDDPHERTLRGSSSSSGAGAGGGAKRTADGASRRLYIKLRIARVRRAAIAAEQRRRSSILEMGALGHLGRAWGLYPWVPLLSRDPYHTPPSPSFFPDYNWGAGIGDPLAEVGAFRGAPVGWLRRAPLCGATAWVRGGGVVGLVLGVRLTGRVLGATAGPGGGRGAGWAGDRMGIPPPFYGSGRRGRFLGQLPGP